MKEVLNIARGGGGVCLAREKDLAQFFMKRGRRGDLKREVKNKDTLTKS